MSDNDMPSVLLRSEALPACKATERSHRCRN